MSKLQVVGQDEVKAPVKTGRPTKYKEWMCDRVIELMAKGCSHREVMADLGIWEEAFYAWGKKHEAFSQAIKRGEQLSQGWWESQGRENLGNPKFSAVLWFMNMKNRFKHDWRDKHEVEVSGEQAMARLDVKQPDADFFASLDELNRFLLKVGIEHDSRLGASRVLDLVR